ncbi:MAG: insulinase family protein [Alphaproteobacteria bacterium]|nr:insulinase family protein [Alphaproteobacteria bacterium]
MASEITKLPNGIVVATDAMPHVHSASLGAWIGIGARHETAELNGISHLLEHMAFKGTERRSALGIAEEIEAVGGHINAYTSRENTAYYAKVLDEHVPLAVDILGDILTRSVFDGTELQRERSVVLQEIGQSHDTPDDIIFDHVQEAAFPNQPVGRPVLGTAETVQAITRDHLVAHVERAYGGDTLLFAASGNVEHDRVVDLVGTHFGALAPTGAGQTEPAAYSGGDIRVERDLEQLHVILGTEGMAFADPDYHAMQVFSTLFGGGMSSRLFQEVREKRGLVYSVFSFASPFLDSGFFGVYAGTGPDEAAELIPVVCEQYHHTAETLSEEEIERAKAQLKASILMGQESTGNRAETLAQHLLIHGRAIPIAEQVAKIEAVDAAQIRRVISRLTATAPTVSAIGPCRTLEPIERIQERLAA